MEITIPVFQVCSEKEKYNILILAPLGSTKLLLVWFLQLPFSKGKHCPLRDILETSRVFPVSQRWERQILPHLEATGFPGGVDGNESACNAGDLGLIPWRRKRLPTPVFWPGEFHGQRSLAGYKSMGSQRVRHD